MVVGIPQLAATDEPGKWRREVFKQCPECVKGSAKSAHTRLWHSVGSEIGLSVHSTLRLTAPEISRIKRLNSRLLVIRKAAFSFSFRLPSTIRPTHLRPACVETGSSRVCYPFLYAVCYFELYIMEVCWEEMGFSFRTYLPFEIEICLLFFTGLFYQTF